MHTTREVNISTLVLAFWFLNYSMITVDSYTIILGKPGKPVERFTGNCGLHNLSLETHFYKMALEGTVITANVSAEVKHPIVTDPILVIELQKCKNAENPDTCEKLPQIRQKHACQFINPDHPLWGPFFATTNPKPKCPIKKDIYKVEHCEIDLKTFFMVPQQVQYWKFKFIGLHNDTMKLLWCTIIETHVGVKWGD